jgi:toxin ParE1/3/4
MKPIRITPKADNDIDKCCAWIRKDNPIAALRFLDAVELTCSNLSQMPGIGSRRYAEISPMRGVRMIGIKGFENYLLFYLEREASVDIIRLLHGARDIPGALQSEEPE